MTTYIWLLVIILVTQSVLIVAQHLIVMYMTLVAMLISIWVTLLIHDGISYWLAIIIPPTVFVIFLVLAKLLVT